MKPNKFHSKPLCFGGRKNREERKNCPKICLFGFPEVLVMWSATMAVPKVVSSSTLIGPFQIWARAQIQRPLAFALKFKWANQSWGWNPLASGGCREPHHKNLRKAEEANFKANFLFFMGLSTAKAHGFGVKFIELYVTVDFNTICSRSNSLLSFSAPDWLQLMWARYSSSTDENFHEFAQSSEHALKVIMTKFVEFVNGHSSVWVTTKKYMPGLYSGYQSHAPSNDFFPISKTTFWWTSIKCIHDNNGERSFRNHSFNVNSQSIRVALSSLLDSSIHRNWEVRLIKSFEAPFRSSRSWAMFWSCKFTFYNHNNMRLNWI